MNNNKGEIIVIEDDSDDIEFLNDIFESLQLPNSITYFEDPTMVKDYLSRPDVRPFLILSDINMPKLDGFELRRLILEDKNISDKHIPYIFLSTSQSPDNISAAFQLSAQGYFKKESNFKDFKSVIEYIVGYWQKSFKPAVSL